MEHKNIVRDLVDIYQFVLEKLPAISVGLVLFLVLFWLSRPLAAFLTKPMQKAKTSKLVQLVVRRIISLLIILIGLYIFLRLAGLTQFAVALLSGTGVIGLIVGFAFKDIAENFLSSLLLSIQRPFKLGDIIEVVGYVGVVNKMTIRATTLVDFNGDHIQLPNATIYKNAIRNLTANPNIRSSVDIGVGYDVDLNQAQSIAMEIMQSHAAILDEPEPQTLIDSLGASTFNLRLYFWVNSEINSPLKVASIIMKQLVQAYLDNKISMPDDARERIILNSSSPSTTPSQPQATVNPVTHNYINEDTSSDHDEIREQAIKARDPEEGNNIL